MKEIKPKEKTKDEILYEIDVIEKSYDKGFFLKEGTPEYKVWLSSHKKAWNKYRIAWDKYQLTETKLVGIIVPSPKLFKV